jgi:hypothetical protein
MATSEERNGYILLTESAGAALRVQRILADWGMDMATINRMLKEQRLHEAERRAESVRSQRINTVRGDSFLAH